MGRRRNSYGVHPRSHPKALRGFVDFDYADKLSPEERAWLADFADRYYGADFRDSDPEQWPLEARRERYVAKNATRTDIASFGVRLGAQSSVRMHLRSAAEEMVVESGPATVHRDDVVRIYDPEGEDQPDISPTPQYLDDPKYKSARESFRSHLSPARRPTEPEDTPELQQARKRLERIVRREQKSKAR